jgi:enoyl-CoA hydratase/carnithine racemase
VSAVNPVADAPASNAEIRAEVRDRILILTIDRPDKKNALKQSMYRTLGEQMQRADEDRAIRAVVVTGAGDVFTAGNDIVDFLSAGGTFEESSAAFFMRSMFNLRKPALAAVNGLAIGIGTTLLLHCDLAYAGESAVFQMPFVNIGIAPEFCSTFLLPAYLGHRRASELLLLGERFDAAKALELGLVNGVVPDAKLLSHTLAIAAKLAAQPPASLRRAKQLMREALKDLSQQAFDREVAALTECVRAPEATEAMTAFMQKRKADFSKFS